MNEEGIKVSARPILVLTCFFIFILLWFYSKTINIGQKDFFFGEIVFGHMWKTINRSGKKTFVFFSTYLENYQYFGQKNIFCDFLLLRKNRFSASKTINISGKNTHFFLFAHNSKTINISGKTTYFFLFGFYSKTVKIGQKNLLFGKIIFCPYLENYQQVRVKDPVFVSLAWTRKLFH